MNITEEHLHHMARRHHATMKKLDAVRETARGHLTKFASTGETAAGAWLGGTLEGRTGGASLGPVPVNLGVGLVLVGASIAVPHFKKGSETDKERASFHLKHIGDGFIASWAAASGFAFGKRWKETGSIRGGGGQPFAHPYAP